MAQLVSALQNRFQAPVIHETGNAAQRRHARVLPSGLNSPSLLIAVQEQLRLKLDSRKERMEIFVVDHAKRPSEN